VNGNVEVRKEGFAGMWRDLIAEPDWKYEELPPFSLPELAKRNLVEVNDSELSRIFWFWSRRPRPVFSERSLLVIEALFALLSLTIPFVDWPSTSILKWSAEVIILLFALVVARCAIAYRLAFLRWRREYERSIDRLIQTLDPGCEGGSAIEW
jgi:hypothetical protein